MGLRLLCSCELCDRIGDFAGEFCPYCVKNCLFEEENAEVTSSVNNENSEKKEDNNESKENNADVTQAGNVLRILAALYNVVLSKAADDIEDHTTREMEKEYGWDRALTKTAIRNFGGGVLGALGMCAGGFAGAAAGTTASSPTAVPLLGSTMGSIGVALAAKVSNSSMAGKFASVFNNLFGHQVETDVKPEPRDDSDRGSERTSPPSVQENTEVTYADDVVRILTTLSDVVMAAANRAALDMEDQTTREMEKAHGWDKERTKTAIRNVGGAIVGALGMSAGGFAGAAAGTAVGLAVPVLGVTIGSIATAAAGKIAGSSVAGHLVDFVNGYFADKDDQKPTVSDESARFARGDEGLGAQENAGIPDSDNELWTSEWSWDKLGSWIDGWARAKVRAWNDDLSWDKFFSWCEDTARQEWSWAKIGAACSDTAAGWYSSARDWLSDKGRAWTKSKLQLARFVALRTAERIEDWTTRAMRDMCGWEGEFTKSAIRYFGGAALGALGMSAGGYAGAAAGIAAGLAAPVLGAAIGSIAVGGAGGCVNFFTSRTGSGWWSRVWSSMKGWFRWGGRSIGSWWRRGWSRFRSWWGSWSWSGFSSWFKNLSWSKLWSWAKDLLLGGLSWGGWLLNIAGSLTRWLASKLENWVARLMFKLYGWDVETTMALIRYAGAAAASGIAVGTVVGTVAGPLIQSVCGSIITISAGALSKLFVWLWRLIF